MPEFKAQFKAPIGKEAIYEYYEFDPTADIDFSGKRLSPIYYSEWIKEYYLPEPFTYINTPVKTITLHKKASDPFMEWLEKVHHEKLWRVIKVTGGDYNFRPIRGTQTTLSMHSLAAALDVDPLKNQLGKALNKTRLGGTEEGRLVVKMAEFIGLTWGGRFARKDAMHFQFAKGA